MDVIDGSEIGAVPSSRSDLAGNGCESVENGRLENSTPLLRLGVLRKMFHRLEAAESLLGGRQNSLWDPRSIAMEYRSLFLPDREWA